MAEKRKPIRRSSKKKISYVAPVRRAKRSYARKYKSSGPSPVINSLAGMAGNAIGDMLLPGIGGRVGGVLAKGAHNLFHKISGLGDYKVNKNSLMVDSVPIISNRSSRTTRVTHREYIKDILSASSANTFNIESFAINPGLINSFPWLAAVAANYEQYKIHGMIFEFKTMSSDALNSTNTALGSVIMATQYNAAADVFTTKQQMENYEFGSSTKPSNSLIHPVECEPRQSTVSELYVRVGSVPSNEDPRLYDFGIFSIATTGLQGTSVNLGELWCTYDIEFFKPKLPYGIGHSDHYQFDSATTAAYFGTAPALRSGSNINTTLTGDKIIFPPSFSGYALVAWYVLGTGANVVKPTVTASAGATLVNLFNNNANYFAYQTPSNAATTNQLVLFACHVAAGGTLTFSGGTLPSSVTSGDLVISQIVNSV